MKINKNISLRFLPEQLYCESLYECGSYEIYLTELVNLSKIREKYNGSEFYRIQRQNNSEPDITNGNYCCDFKLVVSEDYMKIASSFRFRVEKLSSGLATISPRENNNYKAKNVHNMFMLIRFSNPEDYPNASNKELRKFIKNICKDKNMFLFIPIEFIYKENENNEVQKSKKVEHYIYESFKLLKKHRDTLKLHNNDLYVCYIYENNFVILKIYTDHYELIDIINCKKVSNFQERLFKIL